MDCLLSVEAQLRTSAWLLHVPLSRMNTEQGRVHLYLRPCNWFVVLNLTFIAFCCSCHKLFSGLAASLLQL